MSSDVPYDMVDTSNILDRYGRQSKRLHELTSKLVDYVVAKDYHYRSSWRQRGGQGAFFTIVRKWDRIEAYCKDPSVGDQYDLFARFSEEDHRSESITDDCLDLIGYLLVLIEHMIELGHIKEIEDLRLKFTSHTTLTISNPDEIGTTKLGSKPKPGAVIYRNPAATSERSPTGMQNPFGYDEKEEG